MMLLLVGFHTLETDGPCDYEEHYLAKTLNVDVHSQYQIPVDHEHEEPHVGFGEHFGHCSVVIEPSFVVYPYAENKVVQNFHISHIQLSNYISENFRPPLFA